MPEPLQTLFALLLVLSPLLTPIAFFLLQAFLMEKRPPLLLVLPVLTGLLAFGWFPSHWSDLYRVFYVLNTFGAFVGSTVGGVLSAAANWKKWSAK